MNKRFLSLLLIFTFVLSFLPVYADDITPENLNDPNISINENYTNETIEETTINEEITIVSEEDEELDEELDSPISEPDMTIPEEVVVEPIEGTDKTDSENGEILEDEELPDVETTEKEEPTKILEDEEEPKTEPKTVEPISTNDEIVGVKFNYNKYNTQDSKIEEARSTIEEENPVEKPADENTNELETNVIPNLEGIELEENVSINSVENDSGDVLNNEDNSMQYEEMEYDQSLIEHWNNNENYYTESYTEESTSTFSLNAGTYASSTDNNEMVVDVVNNPYFGEIVNGASVSLASGGLGYEKTLISIPGRNGFDVDLTIKYNSDSAVVGQDTYYALAYESEKSHNDFAVGWSFNMTHLTKTRGRYGYYYANPVLTLRDGSSYEIEYYNIDSTMTHTDVTIKDYQLNDVRATVTFDAATKEADQIIIEYSDGVTEYIDEKTGDLIKSVDRFGNTITYEYTDLTYYRGSFSSISAGYMLYNTPVGYSLKLHTLSKIIDSSGKVININYTVVDGSMGTEIDKITVKVNNTTYAVLDLETIDENNNVCVLRSITDGENLTTTFEYEKMLSHTYFSMAETFTFNGTNILMSRVNYPTGGYTDYEYQYERRSMGNSYNNYNLNWYEVYKVSKVVDSDGNETMYEYDGDVSGYPVDYPNDALGGSRQKHSTIVHKQQDDNSYLSTMYTFYQGNLMRETTYDGTTTPNVYVDSPGDYNGSVIIDGAIYRILVNDNALIIYKNDEMEEVQIVSVYNFGFETANSWMSFMNVKTLGDRIIVFVKNTSVSPNVIYAVEYNVATGVWTSGVSDITPPNNIYSIGDYLYSYTYTSSTKKLNMNFYTGDGDWQTFQASVTASPSHVCNDGSRYIYFLISGKLYKYDMESLTTVTAVSNTTFNTSFAKAYYTPDGIYFLYSSGIRFYDFSEDTIGDTVPYPDGVSSTSTSIMGPYNYIYFLSDYMDTCETQCIYVFYGEFYPQIYRLLDENENDDIIISNNTLYIGNEKITLGSTVTMRNDVINTYNEHDQITSTKRREYNDYDYFIWKTQSWTYVDGYSAPLTYTDELGNVTTYTYPASADDNITNLTYLYPATITTYSNTASSVVTTNTRTADNKKLASVSTNYGDSTDTVTYTYDTVYPGNVLEAVTSVTEDGTTTQTGRVTYVYGNKTNNNNAYPSSVTSYNGDTNTEDFTGTTDQNQTVNYEYTPLGQVSREYIIVPNNDEEGTTTTLSTAYTYNKNGILIKETYPDNTFVEYIYTFGDENKVVTSYNDEIYTVEYYDGLGRLIHAGESTDGETLINTVTYGYDHGNVSYSYNSAGLYTYYYYDQLGNVERIINTNNPTEEEYEILLDQRAWYTIGWNEFDYYIGNTLISIKDYDDFGRLEYAEENGVSAYYYYDNRNNMIRYDIGGSETTYTYNNRNQLVEVTDALGNSVLYEYDNRGNTTKVTTGVNEEDNIAGTSVNYAYDSLNRLMSETNQLGNTEYYAYDVRNNLVASKDRKGVVTNYTYDKMNRMLNKTATVSADETEYVTYTYDTLGNVSTMVDKTGTTRYNYNDYNLLSSIITPDNNSISYSYNNLNQLAGVLNYDGEYIEYTYDLMGNVSTISKDEETMATYTYNDKNLLSSVTYPGQGSTTYGYDWALRMNNVTNKLADESVINSYAYTYSNITGNQTSKTETVGTQTKTTSYTYDDLNRLSSYTAPDGTVTTYTFDTRNNITRESIAHSPESTFDYSYYGDDYALTIENITSHTKDYTYNSANQLLTEREVLSGNYDFDGTNTYTYDMNGNMISREASGDYDSSIEYDYSFDAFNRLKTINESRIYYYEDVLDEYEYTYTYNGNNELVNFTNEWNSELSVTKNYYWDRGYMVNEDFASSWRNSTTNYYLGADGVFAQDNGTNTDYLLKNAHGDTVKLLRNGSLYDSAEYDPYGNYTDWNSYSSYGYANYYYDSYSGFYYLRNRFYDPSIGRFVSEDPVHDGMNWYAYAGNNPIMSVDPLGLYEIEIDEDGHVYAIIESGDTLSAIAKAEVNDASAWTKMNYSGDPTKLQIGERVDITGIYSQKYLSSYMLSSKEPPSSSGYVPPKKGSKWDKEKGGWVDAYGNVWVPDKSGHGGEHWDVQYPGGGYDNVYPDGRVRAGSGKRGKFSPISTTEISTNISTSSSSAKISNNNVEKAAVTTIVIYGLYQFVKWGLATATAPTTGGASLMIAGSTP